MRTRLFVLLATLVAASATTGSALARGSADPGPCSAKDLARTSSYVLALGIGPREEMYLPSEVRARKLKTGEVMLGGEMAMLDRGPAGMRIFHLEVHICTKSGAVVTTLKPTIVVQAPGAKQPTHVAVAMMTGVGEGLSGYHYGNDVALTPGSRVTVTVTVKGQRAVFRAVVPKTS